MTMTMNGEGVERLLYHVVGWLWRSSVFGTGCFSGD
jgi:hypothetical protein